MKDIALRMELKEFQQTVSDKDLSRSIVKLVDTSSTIKSSIEAYKFISDSMVEGMNNMENSDNNFDSLLKVFDMYDGLIQEFDKYFDSYYNTICKLHNLYLEVRNDHKQ